MNKLLSTLLVWASAVMAVHAQEDGRTDHGSVVRRTDIRSLAQLGHISGSPIAFNEQAVLGRWDITVHQDGRDVPSWLEIQLSGSRTLVGRFVGGGGSARPISRVSYDNGKISFSIPPQWEREDHDLTVEGALQGDSLVGSIVDPNGKEYKWVGRKAPSLVRSGAPVWGKTIKLFDGADLKGWHAMGKNQWIAEGGVLRSPHSGANIVTDEKFRDFKLHIEFKYPKAVTAAYICGEGMKCRSRMMKVIYDLAMIISAAFMAFCHPASVPVLVWINGRPMILR